MLLSTSRGFSLLEALIAALLVAIAVVGLSHLLTVGAAQAFRTRESAIALMLAQAKLEELRGLAWRFDLTGARVSSPQLETSPPLTLLQDHEQCFETLDRFAAPSGRDDAPHYRRRWAVAPLDSADPDTVAVQVCVFSTGRPGAAAEACVWTIRTRQP